MVQSPYVYFLMLTPVTIYVIAAVIGVMIIGLTVLPIALDARADPEAKEQRAAEKAQRKADKAARKAEKLAAKEAGDDEFEEETAINLSGKEHMRCPHCAHVFTVETPKNTKDWQRGVKFSCPSCGKHGVLPPSNATPVKAVVPGGETKSQRFRCGNCKQEWSVSVAGDKIRKKPQFEACPSCAQVGHVKAV